MNQNWETSSIAYSAIVQTRYTEEEQRNCRYLYIIEPESLDEGDAAEWEGKISTLRKHFDLAYLTNNVQVSKRSKKLERKMDQ